MRQRRVRVMLAAFAVLLMLVVAGCGSSDDGSPTKTTKAASGGGTFTAAEVDAANAGKDVKPVFAVPKDIKDQNLVLGFVNPSLENPFFKTWSDAYKAAAKFYGVQIVENDLNFKWEDTVARFNELKVQNPVVVGTLTTAGDALKKVADRAGIPLLPIDLEIKGNKYFLGVPNDKAGEMGGEIVGKAAADQVAGAWKGRTIQYVGLDNPTCAPCHARVIAGVAGVRKFVDIADGNVTQLNTAQEGDSSNGRRPFADYLTAHPKDAIVVVALNDEVGDGALQAIKAAGREADVKMVTLGADPLAQSDLRKFPQVLVGSVDFNPWREAWNWVEAAIAVHLGKPFATYQVDRIVTPDNVNELYPPTSGGNG